MKPKISKIRHFPFAGFWYRRYTGFDRSAPAPPKPRYVFAPLALSVVHILFYLMLIAYAAAAALALAERVYGRVRRALVCSLSMPLRAY